MRKARDRQIGIPAPPPLSCVTRGKLISSFEDQLADCESSNIWIGSGDNIGKMLSQVPPSN